MRRLFACEKNAGYNANALYLSLQNMAMGSKMRGLAENQFKLKGSMKIATEWLKWVAYKRENPYSSPHQQH